jgi:hypothetical protein
VASAIQPRCPDPVVLTGEASWITDGHGDANAVRKSVSARCWRFAKIVAFGGARGELVEGLGHQEIDVGRWGLLLSEPRPDRAAHDQQHEQYEDASEELHDVVSLRFSLRTSVQAVTHFPRLTAWAA